MTEKYDQKKLQQFTDRGEALTMVVDTVWLFEGLGRFPHYR
jgi:hypothetical protein